MATRPVFKDTDQGPVIRRKLNELGIFFEEAAEGVIDVTADVAQAKAYRDEAEGFKNTASTKAGEAAASASQALTSRNTATTKAGEASTSASNASTSAGQALASKNAAGLSESAAASSASSALSSKNAAGQSETAAAASATAANTAKGLAETARTQAQTAKTAAETAKGLAETARTQAQTAKTGADTAKGLAEDARDTAVTAKDDAVLAKTAAESARTTATGAATTATTKAGEASTSASQALASKNAAGTSASNALDSENKAKDWATKEDDPVEGSLYSSKYYAEQASGVIAGGTVVTHENTTNIHLEGIGNPTSPLKAELVGWQNLPKIKPTLNLDFINQKQLLKGVNFSRATPTWDWDEHGNFRKYEIDEPAIAYDPVTGECKGLQQYPLRTNLAKNSADFLANWIMSEGGGATVEYEYSDDTAIAGTQSVKLTLTIPIDSGLDSRALFRQIVSGTVVGSYYTVSCYVKSVGNNNNGPFSLNIMGGNRGSFTATPDWTRIELTSPTPAPGPTGYYGIELRGGPNSPSEVEILVCGFQVEIGEHATPYIPTEGSQVTVAATNLQIDGDLFDSVYNSKQGTMLFDVGENYFESSSNIFPYANFGMLGSGSFGNSGTGGLVTNGIALSIRDEAGVHILPALNLPKPLDVAPQLGNPYKLGISYTHDQQSIADFGEVATSSRDASGFLENSASRIYVHPHTNGYVKAIKYYNKALPDIDLKELTK